MTLGNFVVGPSHVLPTGGWARTASRDVGVRFLKRTSIAYVTAGGYPELARHARALATYEGFEAHANAVSEIRDRLLEALTLPGLWPCDIHFSLASETREPNMRLDIEPPRHPQDRPFDRRPSSIARASRFAQDIPAAPEAGAIKMGIEPWLGYGQWHVAAKKGLFKAEGPRRASRSSISPPMPTSTRRSPPASSRPATSRPTPRWTSSPPACRSRSSRCSTSRRPPTR